MTATFARLPEGLHSDLHIAQDIKTHTGPYITHGGWKFIVHITVSPWGALHAMTEVVRNKNAEPQVIIGGMPGRKLPTVIQLLELGEFGRSLQHPAGTPETNRARVVQLEICANPGRSAARASGLVGRELGDEGDAMDLFAIPDWHETGRPVGLHEVTNEDEIALCMEDSAARPLDDVTARVFRDGVASWGDATYKALGNLLWLINHGDRPRVDIPTRLIPGAFQTGRRPAAAFVDDAGIGGHMDVPNNTHVDPTTDFSGSKLLKYTKSAPNTLEV